MGLSCPDVPLICTNDLSSLTVCLNLLMCELATGNTCVLPVVRNLSAYTLYVGYVQDKG